MSIAGRAATVLLVLLAQAVAARADYAAEVKALGGAAVHDTIASAESCEVSRIKDVHFDGAPRFEVVGAPAVAGAEAQHILTQFIGRAALRHHRPDDPATPTHLLRFKRGKRVVDVLVSTTDGSFRVVRSGRVVALLGEKQDAVHWARILDR